MTVDLLKSPDFLRQASRVAANAADSLRSETLTDLLEKGVEVHEAAACSLIRTEGDVVTTITDPLVMQAVSEMNKQDFSFDVYSTPRKVQELQQAEDPAQQETLFLDMVSNGLGALAEEEIKKLAESSSSKTKKRSKRRSKKKGKKKASKVKGKAQQAKGSNSVSAPEVYTVKLGVKIETELASETECKVVISIPAVEVKDAITGEELKCDPMQLTLTLQVEKLTKLLQDPQSHYNLLYHRIVERSDWRQFSPAVRNEKRYLLALEIVMNSQRPEGERLTHKEIAQKHGVSENTVSSVNQEVKALSELSRDNFKEDKKGRKNSNFNKIPESAYWKLREALKSVPREYGLNYCVWTGKCIFQFLTENLKVKVNMRYVYYFLDKMGFRLKVATKIHYKYDEEEVKAFIKSLRAKLQKYTDQGYSVVYMDETHLQQGDGLQGYAFGGDEASSDHSASTRRTAYTYIVYMGLKMISITEVCTTMTSQLFITSLENLAFKYPNKKFLIILDNAPVHTSKEVEDWLKKCRIKKKFAFLYLPKYAPKLNPVEYFNNEFKGEMRKKVAHTKKELLQNAREFIHKFVDENNNTLQSAVPKISSYFRAKHCKYFINIYSQVLKSYCTKVKVAKKLLQKLSWRFKNITLDMLISNVKALLKELSKKEREPVKRCINYYSKAINQLNVLIYRS